MGDRSLTVATPVTVFANVGDAPFQVGAAELVVALAVPHFDEVMSITQVGDLGIAYDAAGNDAHVR